MMYQRPPQRRGILPLIIGLAALVVVAGIVLLVLFSVGPLKPDNPSADATATSAASTPITNGSPQPTGPCAANSPYGFTTSFVDTNLVSAYKQLNVCWVRDQINWFKIETQPGVYNWSALDAAVATANQANIHIDFPIQDAPTFHKTLLCYGVPYLPGPNEMAQFATTLATRYDGKHGHGKIDAFEIGNEEFDNHFVQNKAMSEPCRSALVYGPVLKAGFQAIKAVNPDALVGMFGQWLRDIDHIHKFFTDLLSNGYGKYMDYLNFHFYNGQSDPSVSHGLTPSFNEWWQTIHTIATQYGDGSKPIWVTETGWATKVTLHTDSPVDTQTQAKYLQYVYTQALQSNGVVQKVFWFTINYKKQGDSLNPSGQPDPAFFTYQTMVRDKPIW